MCVSDAQEKRKRNCVKYLGMRVLNDSAARCFICSLQAFIVCVRMQMCGDVCAHLCRHTSMNFIAVLIRSRYAWRGVGICVCVLCAYEYEFSSPVSDQWCKERKHRGEYLFQMGEIPLYEDKQRMKQRRKGISELKTCRKFISSY